MAGRQEYRRTFVLKLGLAMLVSSRCTDSTPDMALLIEERMRLLDGGPRLVYGHPVTGPDAVTDVRDIRFALMR